jgi:exodeoxyribonuclease VII large subunit
MLTSLSVKDLVQAIKKSVDQNFSAVKVSGELTNVSKSISGHFYFSLSDDEAMISCVIFKNAAMRIPHLATLKDGENVEISGQVSVYAKRGNLQIIVSDLTLLNKDGLLKKKFEEVKKKLALEGLFDIEKKKKIPLMAKKIAVVAAPRSAALQDFLTVLGRRAFFYDVLIIPALVQGEGAAVSLRKAIKLADSKEDIDVIVVTRGGGSLEDLWCFNDEELARTIFQCSKPVISAVGHDVDYTIIDYVSDQRCETPTAAAELISAYQLKVRDQMENYFQRILRVMEQKVTRVKVVLERLSPHFILARMNNRLRSLKNKLEILIFLNC